MDERDPVERQTWPAALAARVVDSGAAPRIHGYGVDDDLGPHWSFGETLYLLVTGELPTPDAGRAFEVALVFASPVSAGDAASHGASLARLCGARSKNVVAVAAVGAAERAGALVDPVLLAWLEGGGEPPKGALAASPDPRTVALRNALPSSFAEDPRFAHPLRVEAAIVMVLHAAGVRSVDQLVLALTMATLPAAASEGLATPPLDFKNYPTALPLVEYVEGSK